MCNPVVLPAIMMAMTVASTALTVVGSMNQASAAKQAGKANAEMAKDQAAAEREAAAYDAKLIRERYARVQASQRAGYGTSGVVMEGTPLDVLSQTAYEGERDALNALYGGELKARNLYAQASLGMFEGSSTSSYYQTEAASSLLGGAASIAGQGVKAGFWGGSGGRTPISISGTIPTYGNAG